MISIKTSDGAVHKGRTWQELLTKGHPDMTAGVTLGALISLCQKELGVDVTFGQEVTNANGMQMLARLHECKIVTLDLSAVVD